MTARRPPSDLVGRRNLRHVTSKRRAQLSLAGLLTAAAFLAGCGGGDNGNGSADGGPAAPEDPGPVHVHGLGINPKDGALFIATHTGLFRAGPEERKAKRVADRFQDTMGFTVVGPNHFLGSGHPDLRDGLPPFLGLIESRDAGETWKPISLLGERDFHVLEAFGRRIYGFGSNFKTRAATLVMSRDGGRSWQERSPPEALMSLAIDPTDSDRVVVSGEQALYLSINAGRSWRKVSGEPSLLTWPERGRLYAVDFAGNIARSVNTGRQWRRMGAIGGEPAAFDGSGRGDLYVALHNGTIKRSTDGGSSWSVRSAP
jgi:hypothetical protein